MATTLPDYEKLGVFYLGREHDLSKRQTGTTKVLYDSKDLVTHAVCVGMTGSGKTGLCIDILEEAAIDNIPAIVVDPKGDLANLLLTFPDLKPEDFKPWINPDDAKRKGVSEDEFAAAQAKLWTDGLAKWDEDGDRIRRLKAAAEFSIYTPGSNAGIPVSILKSFDVPPQEVLDDNEAFRDRISTTATSLLGLLGIDADPVQSREHILISNIFADAWGKKKQNLDMASLIQAIQEPPMQKIGVMDLNSFYPQKERFGLAMQLNNLLAAPGFAQWMEGIPLDISSILHNDAGKPRIAIFSISHLSDPERMFFVSLLLNQVLGWMRSQGGTTSLRALFYMDEIFGYFPPTANPPSKQPLLTLLKQARAFGLGIMLATQNPVDLDYKGLANCGTWFVGRLQTDRDKQRLLDGLEGAAASANQKFNKSDMEKTLAGLGSRVFLMNNVHEDAPVIFETRWSMSYLRGPLGKADIRKLMDAQKTSAPASSAGDATAPTEKARGSAGGSASSVATARPVLPPTIPQLFLPVRSATPQGASLVYSPMVLGTADVYFIDKASKIDSTQQMGLLSEIIDGPVPVEWTTAFPFDTPDGELSKTPESGAAFSELPAVAAQQKNFDAWSKSFADGLYRICTLNVYKCDDLDIASNGHESEREFRVRLDQTLREQRDGEIEKLRAKYATKLNTLTERLRKAQMAEEKERQEASSSKWTAALSVGASVLGAFLGRKAVSATNLGKIGTAARTVGTTMKQSGDVARAQENVGSLQQQVDDLNAQLQGEIDTLSAKYNRDTIALEKVSLRPKKTDIKPRVVALAWAPSWKDASGNLVPAWE